MIVAFTFAPTAVPLVKEIPYLNKIVSGCEATTIISFAFVLGLVNEPLPILNVPSILSLLNNLIAIKVYLCKDS